MAFYLHRLSFLYHLVQVLPSDAGNSFFHPLLTAAAEKPCICLVQNFQLKLSEELLKHLFRGNSSVQAGSDGFHHGQLFLQLINHRILRKGHKLDNKSAGLLHCIVSLHQHTQAHGRRRLFRIGKVIGQILSNLSCLKFSLSNIWLFHAHILYDAQDSQAKSAPHIQLAFCIGRQHHARIFRKSFYVRMGIGCYGQTANWSAAFNLKRKDILRSLHHSAHHGSCRQEPPKGRRSHRAGVVRLSGCLHNISGCNGKRADLTVRRSCPHNIIFHMLFSCSSFLRQMTQTRSESSLAGSRVNAS